MAMIRQRNDRFVVCFRVRMTLAEMER